MLKQVIRLTQPGVFVPYLLHEPWPTSGVAVRPTYLSICAADQRYFRGNRPEYILRNKLPMALLHEAVGEVLFDPQGEFAPGSKVVLVPCAKSSETSYVADNYREGGIFHSSNCDGFAQELLVLPRSQLVRIKNCDEKIYVFAELLSVCIHAVKRWLSAVGDASGKTVGIWGDGTVSFLLSLTLKNLAPDTRVIVFGKHDEKLVFFSFVDEVININAQRKMRIHHAFECVGGVGSESAIQEIIRRIYPQGIIFLLGVSEVDPPIHTRLVLEKGLIIIGCSRSSYKDFETAATLIDIPAVQGNLQKIISKEISVKNSNDLESAFTKDTASHFKTIIHWGI